MREWLHPGTELEDRPWRAQPLPPSDSEWAYVPVRRLAAYVEASIRHGLQWVVFEPGGDQLWAAVRQQVEEFLTALWHEGRLCGETADEAFFVRCDSTTMTQDDLDSGRLVALVGMAVLRPAEFVVIRIGQWTADVDRDPDDD
jgi:phage tail sheath protein FI